MNKYEKHYQSLQTSDLLRKLLEHKLQTQPLGKDWADALQVVLSKQNLQGKYRQVFIRIQDSDAFQLGENGQEMQKFIDELQAEELRDNPFVIDPMKIAEAGRTLKMMVRLLTAFFIIVFVLGIILGSDPDYGTRGKTLMIFGLVALLMNAAFLVLTFSTGSLLQESVRRKNP